MNVRYVCQDLDWTDQMKTCVQERIVDPLRAILRTDHFDISVNFEARRLTYVMWAVLQTFDGRRNEVVRLEGHDFYNLADEVADCVQALARKRKSA